MSGEFSLAGVLERMYENQIALEAAIMELTLLAEAQVHQETGGNIRGALQVIEENAGYIKQGIARVKAGLTN